MATDLRKIYTSVTVAEAEQELADFADRWDNKYPSISQSWTRHWPNIITLFDYPDDIRKVIYTTNAIESLNSVIRKAINNRKLFPNDQVALKVVYLAIEAAAKKGAMPIRHWHAALNRFMIEFPGECRNMYDRQLHRIIYRLTLSPPHGGEGRITPDPCMPLPH